VISKQILIHGVEPHSLEAEHAVKIHAYYNDKHPQKA